ncbi:MAG: flagellar protein FlaG [Nitrospinota bacterium]|nr:flagellar protein FlaG [Nitrospinota bacterium]
MEVNSIDAAQKRGLLVRDAPPAKSIPPESSGPKRAAPNRKNDSVILSEIGKQTSGQPQPVTDLQPDLARKEPENNSSSTRDGNTQRKLSVAEDMQVILKIIDPKTKNVIKQLPAEDQVKLREAMRNMVENFLSPNQTK